MGNHIARVGRGNGASRRDLRREPAVEFDAPFLAVGAGGGRSRIIDHQLGRGLARKRSRSQFANCCPIRSAPERLEVVADVTKSEAEAKWSVARRNDRASNKLRVGDIVYVTQGQMQVTFECGAVVTLYAPAEMEVISPMRGRAIRGKLAAYVVEGAEGFTIETPRATVVDLGTVFGVEVGAEGETDVVVFKGALDLHLDAAGDAGQQLPPHRLTIGRSNADRQTRHRQPNRFRVKRPIRQPP